MHPIQGSAPRELLPPRYYAALTDTISTVTMSPDLIVSLGGIFLEKYPLSCSSGGQSMP